MMDPAISARPPGRFAWFSDLELTVLRPGSTSRRPTELKARAVLVDEIDAEWERRAQTAAIAP